MVYTEDLRTSMDSALNNLEAHVSESHFLSKFCSVLLMNLSEKVLIWYYSFFSFGNTGV
jgi:hypothetical protein